MERLGLRRSIRKDCLSHFLHECFGRHVWSLPQLVGHIQIGLVQTERGVLGIVSLWVVFVCEKKSCFSRVQYRQDGSNNLALGNILFKVEWHEDELRAQFLHDTLLGLDAWCVVLGADSTLAMNPGIADRTPNLRASYDAVLSMLIPPTAMGLPRRDGLDLISTLA